MHELARHHGSRRSQLIQTHLLSMDRPQPQHLLRPGSDLRTSSPNPVKIAKVYYRSIPGGASRRASARKPARPQTHEMEQQKDAYIQVGRYLLKQFLIPAFRSRATVGSVDRNRIQFYHENYPVILVSSAIAFSRSGDVEGLEKFIVIVIAFCRLSPRANDILYGLHGKLFRDNWKLLKSKLAPKTVRIREEKSWSSGETSKRGGPHSHTARSSLTSHRWPDGRRRYFPQRLRGFSTSILWSKSVGPALGVFRRTGS